MSQSVQLVSLAAGDGTEEITEETPPLFPDSPPRFPQLTPEVIDTIRASTAATAELVGEEHVPWGATNDRIKSDVIDLAGIRPPSESSALTISRPLNVPQRAAGFWPMITLILLYLGVLLAAINAHRLSNPFPAAHTTGVWPAGFGEKGENRKHGQKTASGGFFVSFMYFSKLIKDI